MTAGPAIPEVDAPAMPAEAQQEPAASADEQGGDMWAQEPRDPAPASGNGVAGGPFARTKQAVEAGRSDAEGALAWSHTLRTPEEIGATQDSRLGRLLRRLFRFGRAAPGAAGPLAAADAPLEGTPRRAGGSFGRRPSRAATAPRRNTMAFVLALCVGALVTSLLFGGLLGLPDRALTSRWVSWPFAQEERQAAPPARGEVVVADLPEVAGQGGPEIALGREADGSSNAMDAAGRAARSEPSGSDLVAVAGSPPDTWHQYYRIGHRLHAEGDLRGAVEMYRQAAALEPDDATTLYEWARALQMLGDRDGAIQKYRAAVELAPDSQTGTDARTRLSELQDR